MKRVLLILILVCFVLAGGGGYLLWQQYDSFLKQPLQTVEGGTVFEIKPGSNIRKVAKQLVSDGLLSSFKPVSADWLFVAHARITEKASKIKAGEYALPVGILPDQLLELFVSGKTLQYQIGFVEGRSFKEIAKIVKLKTNNIKVKLFRSRKKLACILKERLSPEIIEHYDYGRK